MGMGQPNGMHPFDKFRQQGNQTTTNPAGTTTNTATTGGATQSGSTANVATGTAGTGTGTFTAGPGTGANNSGGLGAAFAHNAYNQYTGANVANHMAMLQQFQQYIADRQKQMDAWRALRPDFNHNVAPELRRDQMQDWRDLRPEISPFNWHPTATNTTTNTATTTNGTAGTAGTATNSNVTTHAAGGPVYGNPYQQVVQEDPRMAAMRYMQLLANQRRG